MKDRHILVAVSLRELEHIITALKCPCVEYYGTLSDKDAELYEYLKLQLETFKEE